MNAEILIGSCKPGLEQPSYIKRVLVSLITVFMVGLLIGGGVYLFSPDTMPIKHVRIEGDFTRLSPVYLQSLVADKVRGGFFSVNVDATRDALIAEPWISFVTVQRIWPDALRVIVTEQIPVVRWKGRGLLNSTGVYFEPDAVTIPQDLVKLSGPPGSEAMLLQRLNAMQEAVKSAGFRIAELTLDERRAWSFQLTNGIQVVIGRRDFEERFQRFLRLMPAILAGRTKQTDMIDMRYTNGFSIKWKIGEPLNKSIHDLSGNAAAQTISLHLASKSNGYTRGTEAHHYAARTFEFCRGFIGFANEYLPYNRRVKNG